MIKDRQTKRTITEKKRKKMDGHKWICHKLKKRRAHFFRDYPNVIRFKLVHLCPSMLLLPFAVFLLCCSQF